MQDILDLILSNKVYMVAAGVVVMGIIIFLLKKVFKMMMIGVAIILAYVAFLYVTEDNPMKVIKEKFQSSKSVMEDIDGATKDLRRDAIDKVIDDVDKRLNDKSKKKR